MVNLDTEIRLKLLLILIMLSFALHRLILGVLAEFSNDDWARLEHMKDKAYNIGVVASATQMIVFFSFLSENLLKILI